MCDPNPSLHSAAPPVQAPLPGAGKHQPFEHLELEGRLGVDQRLDQFRRGEQRQQLLMLSEHCESAQMLQEHRAITADEVGGYKEKPHETYCET